MEPTRRTIPTSPEKDIFDTLIADISYEDAICELIDNSIDSAHRLEDTSSVRIDVEYSSLSDGEHDTVLRLKDNGGGIKRDNLPILTKLSSSRSADLDASIGTYGVGVKRACAKLGGDALILSRHEDSNAAYGFEIPAEWYEEDDWRDFGEVQDDSLSPGSTEITIYDVSYGFNSESLKNHISRTYGKYLRGEATELEVSIFVNGDQVEAPSETNWSYTPFNFHPRQYPEIPLMPEEADMDEPVYLTITVGLLQGSDGDNEPGTDIYCQGRKVVHADQGRKGGHVRQYLKEWSNDKGRFKIVLEFETEGENKHLPWTSTKADIDVSSLVYMKGMDWARKIADAYRKIGYDIPDPFVKPYTADHEDATPIEVFRSYREYSSDRDRIRRGEKIDYDTARGLVINIKNKADRHAIFHIICPSSVNDEYYQGYRGRVLKRFTSKYDGVTDDDIVEIEDPPQELNQQNYERITGDLQQKAEEDAEENIRDGSTLPGWQEPLYTFYLQQNVNSLEQLTDLSDIEEETGSQTQPSSTAENSEQEDDQIEESSNATSSISSNSRIGNQPSPAEIDTEAIVPNENNESIDNVSSSREFEGETAIEEDTENSTENITEFDSTEAIEASNVSTDETAVLGEAEPTTIPVEIPPNLWTDLCDALELPDSSDPSEVGEEVSELLESLVRIRIVDEARSKSDEPPLDESNY